MKVLSFRAKSSSCDEIPLNKSFESTGTSDQLLERDKDSSSTTEPVATLWSVTAVQNPRRPSFASTETLKVRNSAKSMPNHSRPSLYSASLGAMLESTYDFCDEPEPRAVVVPRPPIIRSQYTPAEDEKSEFFDNMIAMKSDLNRRWKEETRSTPEEGNVLAADDVWVEHAKFVSYDKESSEDFVEETRTHALAVLQRADEQEPSRNSHDSSNCNEIVWKAWGCNDLRTRRHIMCFVLLLFLLFLVMALLLGFYIPEEPAQSVSAANKPQDHGEDGAGAWTGDLPSENTPQPKPRPTNVPEPVPAESLSSATQSPTLETTTAASPRAPTTQPARPSPEPGFSPSSWPVMSSPPPTIVPTIVSTNMPTGKPSSATQIPTNRASTNSPSEQPSICQSSLTVNKSCYVEDQDVIVINFVNCSPEEGDWVGIWRTREDPSNLSDDFVDWAWSCGTKDCRRSPASKRMTIDAYGLGFDSFQAFLVHDTPVGTPYIVVAMSEPFVVTNFCPD